MGREGVRMKFLVIVLFCVATSSSSFGTLVDKTEEKTPSSPLTAMPLANHGDGDWAEEPKFEVGLSLGTPSGFNVGLGVRNVVRA